MSDTKRLGLPLAIILLGALAVWLIDNYLVMNAVVGFFRTMVIVFCYFFFGYYLNKKKRSNAVFKKVIAILLTVLLTCMRYDLSYVRNGRIFYHALYLFRLFVCGLTKGVKK